ncbi:MAG: phage major capsid protein, partial [Kiritimatiellae bacterium]|nr:phage major capsid protein [Kiritimatiellia bacterium]
MNMKKILEMKAKREDARLKAMAVLGKAEAEDRFLTEEEQKEIDKYEGEIRSWDDSINRAERLLTIEPEDRTIEKPESKPAPGKSDEKRFASFGEQPLAAYRAAAPGGSIDERLTT